MQGLAYASATPEQVPYDPLCNFIMEVFDAAQLSFQMPGGALVSLFEQSLVEKARVHLHSKRSAQTTTVVLDAPLRAKDTVSHRRQTMQLVATVPLPQQILTLFLAKSHHSHLQTASLPTKRIMFERGGFLSKGVFEKGALLVYRA